MHLSDLIPSVQAGLTESQRQLMSAWSALQHPPVLQPKPVHVGTPGGEAYSNQSASGGTAAGLSLSKQSRLFHATYPNGIAAGIGQDDQASASLAATANTQTDAIPTHPCLAPAITSRAAVNGCRAAVHAQQDMALPKLHATSSVPEGITMLPMPQEWGQQQVRGGTARRSADATAYPVTSHRSRSVGGEEVVEVHAANNTLVARVGVAWAERHVEILTFLQYLPPKEAVKVLKALIDKPCTLSTPPNQSSSHGLSPLPAHPMPAHTPPTVSQPSLATVASMQVGKAVSGQQQLPCEEAASTEHSTADTACAGVSSTTPAQPPLPDAAPGEEAPGAAHEGEDGLAQEPASDPSQGMTSTDQLAVDSQHAPQPALKAC